MKIVFLDIDGVLNTESFVASVKEAEDAGRPHPDGRGPLSPFPTDGWWSDMLDREAVDLLNQVAPVASFVISSTWRINKSLEDMQNILNLAGLQGKVVGMTARLHGHERGKEISAFLTENPNMSDFVILDDRDDMAPNEDRLVKTDSRTGLQPSHVDRILELLGV